MSLGMNDALVKLFGEIQSLQQQYEVLAALHNGEIPLPAWEYPWPILTTDNFPSTVEEIRPQSLVKINADELLSKLPKEVLQTYRSHLVGPVAEAVRRRYVAAVGRLQQLCGEILQPPQPAVSPAPPAIGTPGVATSV